MWYLYPGHSHKYNQSVHHNTPSVFRVVPFLFDVPLCNILPTFFSFFTIERHLSVENFSAATPWVVIGRSMKDVLSEFIDT